MAWLGIIRRSAGATLLAVMNGSQAKVRFLVNEKNMTAIGVINENYTASDNGQWKGKGKGKGKGGIPDDIKKICKDSLGGIQEVTDDFQSLI